MAERLNGLKGKDAVPEHLASFEPRPATRSNFDAALLAYLERQPRSGRDGLRDGRRAAMLAVFEGRATWHQIKDWRRAWRRVPAWAWDMLDSKLAARERNTAIARNLARQ